MKKSLLILLTLVSVTLPVKAAVLTSIPGPDDQGGMIMPMVTLSGNALTVMFMPPSEPPLLASLDYWSPGDTFQTTAAWYSHLDPVGGDGTLFNNQYGFTFMGSIPTGTSLGIRLISTSSNLLQAWNYVNSQNRFDEIFQNVGDQVLWNGSMWHNYFTIASDATPGIYSATFEVFIADQAFTAGTGFADYAPNALTVTQNTNYSTVNITYTWEVAAIPEPSTVVLLGGAWVFAIALNLRNRKQQQS